MFWQWTEVHSKFFIASHHSHAYIAYSKELLEIEKQEQDSTKLASLALVYHHEIPTQPAFTCSKLTIETLEQGVKLPLASFWCLYCLL